MNNNIIEEMASEALKDDYFIELFTKLENNFFNKIVYKNDECKLTDLECSDLLSFADILSLSSIDENKNISIKIISLLNVFFKDNALYNYYAKGIMLRLGNFPSYELISKNTNIIWAKEPMDIVVEKILKQSRNKDPNNNEKIFTDSQFEVYNNLINKNHFSFSGPTSFGKSFILNSFISHIINSNNNGINMAYIVPTRALVSQNIKVLKEIIKDKCNYILLESPDIPACFLNKNKNFIFVFTPERLVEYLSNENNPTLGYIFVDEAQKMLSIDSRSAIYYHALSMAERKSCKLFFSSPNINNANVFLSIFDKSEDECLHITESPVCQNRCFIDIENKKLQYFSNVTEPKELDYNLPDNIEDIISQISNEGTSVNKSIIYCNTIEDTINFALSFSKKCKSKDNEKINNAIEVIKEHIHEDYFLIDCIKNGVAFHFGKLPQRIRNLIENMYIEGDIDYLFCTSTLLEGVNLPAQNIYILSSKIGNTRLTSVDFWNLAGRAGRLAKDLYGNVFCIRWGNVDGHWNKDKDIELLKNKKVEDVKCPLLTGEANFYKNVRASLLNKPFTTSNPRAKQREIWNSFANILMIQNSKNDSSLLKDKFIGKIPDSRDILNKIKKSITISYKTLNKSPLIKWRYQESLLKSENLPNMEEPTFNNCLELLNVFYDKYNWEKEESFGNNPLINMNHLNPKSSLQHYAFIMSEWMSGTTINILIKRAIRKQTGGKFRLNFNEYVIFDPNNKKHVNKLINNIMDEIDRLLRFKIKNYCENYFNILREKGVEGVNDWATYLEHGSKKYEYIELQKIGIPRHLVERFYVQNKEFLVFDKEVLKEIDLETIKNKLKDSTVVEDIEILNILNDLNL